MNLAGKLLAGGGLIVTGGVLVSGAYFAGFISGIALMEWSDQKDEEKAKADQAVKASTKNPATGADLPPERIVEINASTPEEPVWVTQEEMAKMKQIYLQVALGAGRLKIVGYHDRKETEEVAS